MTPTRRALLGSAAALPLAAPALARAQPSGDAIRIGVLTDLAGPYRDVTGLDLLNPSTPFTGATCPKPACRAQA